MRTYDDPVIAGFRPDPSVPPRATAAGPDRPGRTFVGRCQQRHDCRFAARLEPGTGCAGLSGRLDGAYHYDIEAAGIGPVRQCLARRTVDQGPVTLTVEVRTDSPVCPTGWEESGVRAGGPRAVALGIDGVRPAELDGRYLSAQVVGGFTGRVVGMYVTEGGAAFDWFEHVPEPQP